MEKTKWFERSFSPIGDNGLLPGIIERLEGTPARLYYKTGKLNDNSMPAVPGTQWSIKKEIGHLVDLESLWLERVEQLVMGAETLGIADLNNTRTHETDHDSKAILELLQNFFESRMVLVNRLRELKDAELTRSALHPRLQTPMRVIDLAYFVAEHDDHHLAQITWIIQNDKNWMTAGDVMN
jgi:uncharacterized damage-inducible protein DinB